MSWNPDENISESEEEEEIVGSKGREAYIFVLDALLFRDYEMFLDCLEIIRDAFLNGLLTRGKDLIGMVLNNTEHSPPPKDSTGMENIVPHKNTAVFIPLRPLSKEAVDYFLNFQAPDHFDFESKYGCKEGSFANMIWLCTNMFQQCGYKLSLPAIIYFTAKESPHSLDSSEFQQAMRKANDLNDINVDFTVVPMCDQFDYEVFYKEFFCTITDTELDSYTPEDPKRIRSVIANRMVRKNFQTHCTSFVRWNIGDNLSMSVGIYNFYKRTYYPQPVRLFREDNSLIESKRTYKISSISNPEMEEKISLPNEQRKQITIGGNTIYFTNDELLSMKCPMGPGIQLLGFKPRSTLKQQNFLKSADFLFPNEKYLTGSTKLFRAIWEKCLEKEKIAFCVLVAKRTSSPQYVALIPVKKESSDQAYSSIYSEGFHIWYLPCYSDIRRPNLPERPTYQDSEEDIGLIAALIKKLRTKKKLRIKESFKDPSLSILRANIVDVAFDVETENPIDLNSLDCMGIIEGRLNTIVSSFKEDIKGINQDPEVSNPAQKRKTAPSQSQRSKVVKTAGALTKADIDQYIANGTLEKLTIKDLKEYLQANNISGLSSAKKPMLIEKVLDLHRSE